MLERLAERLTGLRVPYACGFVKTYRGDAASVRTEQCSSTSSAVWQPCHLLKRDSIPKHRATAPIATNDFASVRTENRAGDAVRVNELGDLVAGFCIRHSRC